MRSLTTANAAKAGDTGTPIKKKGTPLHESQLRLEAAPAGEGRAENGAAAAGTVTPNRSPNMKFRESGMPEETYWESLFDVPLILDRL